MSITSFSVKNYQFTIIVFVLALALGISALLNMPRGEDPPFGAPIFIVLAVYPGTSPTDMEQLVVKPIEDAIYNLEELKKLQTDCSDGLMIMKIEFNYGVDVDEKNNDVIREVNKIRSQLPEDILILDVERAASSDVSILQTALVSATASVKEINDYAERLKKDLERIKDLKWVKIQANPEEIVDIELRLDNMAQYQISLSQVIQILQANNLNIPGGSVDIGSKRFNIKTNSELKTIQDIEHIIVKPTAEGKVIHLNEIAFVRMDKLATTHIARFNGQPAVWVISAQKDKKNIILVRKQMELVLDQFKEQLPSHIELKNSFDQESSVKRRLSGLAKDFSIAVFLVLLTLLPLGIRAAFIVLISIPLSLSIGLAFLDMAGFTLNQLSIVGMVIALGLLVDDSIVVVENIERFIRGGLERKKAAIIATKQITTAVIGCTATLILAFLPLAFLPGGAGEFIRSLPMAVLLTIVASLFVSLTIIPFLASMFLSSEHKPQGNMFLRAFQKYVNLPYEKILLWSFRHPAASLISVGIIVVGSLMLIPKLGFSLFPVSDKPMFLIDIQTSPGSNLKITDQLAQKVEKILFTKKEISSISTNIGKGNPRVYYNEFQQDFTPNFAQIFVQLHPNMEVPAITAFTDSLRIELKQFAGARIEVRMFQQGPPIPAPIEFRIVGDNIDSLSKYSVYLEEVIKKTAGTLYVRNDLKLPNTDISVRINREKAGLLGVLPIEIARTVRLGLAGLTVGQLRPGEGEELDIHLSLGDLDSKESLKVFEKMYVSSLSGQLIPLYQIAQIELAESAPVIRHFNKDRYTSVTSFVKTGFNTMALIDQITDKTKSLSLPKGYYFVAAGEKESRDDSFGGMGTIILISVLGLLAILVLEFRTFKSTIIVLSVIPLGIVGAILMLFISGETLSFVATIGMIALVGIEIKNSILLVDYTNHLREQGMALKEAIVKGAETRFLPIILTSMTAIGGMIPLVLERSPLISPLALVLIGGLISSTLLSRIVTPLLYLLIPPKISISSDKQDYIN
ncbi:MAG: efflux RND transporter permease subunit [Bacteroidota bacterium]|nr:efflux RND transporter permease subunit [Bacteroidota bacterium]